MNSSIKLTSVIGLGLFSALAISEYTGTTQTHSTGSQEQGYQVPEINIHADGLVEESTQSVRAFTWQDVTSPLFPMDQARVIDWMQVDERVEALVEHVDHEKAIWLTVEHSDTGEWIVKDAAFAGEYVFLTEQLSQHTGFESVSQDFISLEERDMFSLLEVRYAGIEGVVAADRRLREHAGDVQVERNLVVYATSTADDPGYASSWTLQKLELDPVWARYGFEPHGTNPRAVIAVIDSGASDQGDFRFWKNTAEIAGNGIDDDGNGFIDDVNGWDFFKYSNEVSYAGSHGAEVSRIAASLSGNGIGRASPASSAELMRVLYSGTVTGSLWMATNASLYAVRNGADVVNWSFVTTGEGYFPAIATLGANNNIMFVAAAGNNGKDLSTLALYPAKVVAPNVICAGASSSTDQRGNSNFGKDWVHVFAPGTATSYSTPLVTSTIALLKALNPEATVDQIVAAIMGGVDHVTALASSSISGGRLNVKKTVEIFMGVDLDVPEEVLPIIEVPQVAAVSALPSEVSFSLGNITDAQIELQYSRDGGEFICTTSNTVIEGDSVVVRSLIEGASYVFRMRYVSGEVTSDWVETASVTTPVYIERSTIAQMPVHYWNFAATATGLIKDYGTAKSDLILEDASFSNGAKDSGALVLGLAGESLVLPAAFDAAEPIESMTVGLWIKLDTAMSDASGVVLDLGDSWAGMNLVLDRGHLVASAWNRLRDGNVSAFSTTLNGGAVATGEWMHLALVLRGSKTLVGDGLVLYINGKEVAKDAAAAVALRGSNAGVGSIDGDTRFRNRALRRLEVLSAELDQIGFWQVSLGQADIQTIVERTFR